MLPVETDNWAIHGRTTFVSQYAPPFHAAYRSANSLDSNTGRETWGVTAYMGHRLRESAEFWIDPVSPRALTPAPARARLRLRGIL
jgi:high affinity Mn2+ porin